MKFTRMTLAPLLCTVLAAQPASNVFPMSKGTSWIYAGSMAWDDGGKRAEKQLSCKSEIVDSLERGRFRVALIRGDPRESTCSGSDPKRGCYLLISVNNRAFYSLQSDCALPRGALADLAIPSNLFLKLPAKNGDSFGGDPEREKKVKDGMYAWSFGGPRRLR